MNLISISPDSLRIALQRWEQQARNGGWQHDPSKTVEQLAAENAALMWSLLNGDDLGLPPIGTGYEGGYFAGLINQVDGLYGLVAAPKAQGDFRALWLSKEVEISGADSLHDGAANTRAMAEAGSPLAQRALGLSINGHADWYVPARDELEMVYRAFKPTADDNARWCGDNCSSVPIGRAYLLQTPAQTTVPAFIAGAMEALEPTWYWSSSQYSRLTAWLQGFDVGNQLTSNKGYEGRARAVRRFKVQ